MSNEWELVLFLTLLIVILVPSYKFLRNLLSSIQSIRGTKFWLCNTFEERKTKVINAAKKYQFNDSVFDIFWHSNIDDMTQLLHYDFIDNNVWDLEFALTASGIVGIGTDNDEYFSMCDTYYVRFIPYTQIISISAATSSTIKCSKNEVLENFMFSPCFKIFTGKIYVIELNFKPRFEYACMLATLVHEADLNDCLQKLSPHYKINVVTEKDVSIYSRFQTKFDLKLTWGYFLGLLCTLRLEVGKLCDGYPKEGDFVVAYDKIKHKLTKGLLIKTNDAEFDRFLTTEGSLCFIAKNYSTIPLNRVNVFGDI